MGVMGDPEFRKGPKHNFADPKPQATYQKATATEQEKAYALQEPKRSPQVSVYLYSLLCILKPDRCSYTVEFCTR